MYDPRNMPIRYNGPHFSNLSAAARAEAAAGAAEAGRHAHSRAVAARYLSEVFSEPDALWRLRLTDNETQAEVKRALHCLGLPPGKGALSAIPPADQLLEERNRLFGHTVRSACPLYELEYGRGEVFQQSQSLADLAGFYSAFGYQTGGRLAERPDHLVTELEFLSVLALKETIANHAGTTSDAECCREAQRKFLADHAATWMPAFCARVRKAAPGSFFNAAADFAEALVVSWCDSLEVAIGPVWLELREVEAEDSTITCGMDGDTPRVELGPTLAAGLNARS